MDRLGGDFVAYTDREDLVLSLTSESTLADKAQEFLIEILLERKLEASSIESEKKIVLNEINQTYDDPEEWLWDEALSSLTDDFWGLPVLGLKSSIQRIDFDSLQHFYQRLLFVPRMLVISGSFSENNLLQNWENLSVLQSANPGTRSLTFKPPQAIQKFKRESLQVYLLGIVPIDQELDISMFLMLQVLMHFWGGANSSRLFQKAREERGWCYNIQSGFQSALKQGLCFVQASTLPKNSERLIRLIEKEWVQLWDNLTPDDWIFYRDAFAVQTKLQMEKLDFRSEMFYTLSRYFDVSLPLSCVLQKILTLDYDSLSVSLKSFLRNKAFQWYCVSPK